jgi:hypothetical protein
MRSPNDEGKLNAKYEYQDDQKISVHSVITIQKVTCNVQRVLAGLQMRPPWPGEH